MKEKSILVFALRAIGLLYTISINCFFILPFAYIITSIIDFAANHALTQAFGSHQGRQELVYLILSFFLAILYALIMITPVGFWWIKRQHKFRPIKSVEKNRLMPLLDNFKGFNRFNVYVVEDEFPNAFALGKNNIAYTTGFLNIASDEEIMGVTAHEISHCMFGDSVYSTFNFSLTELGTLCYDVILRIIRFTVVLPVAFFAKMAERSLKLKEGLVSTHIINFSNWMITMAGVLIYKGLYGINNVILMKVSRNNEFRCDRFAARAGLGMHLISFLNKLQQMEDPNGAEMTLAERAFSTHPKTVDRISALHNFMTKS